MKRKIQVLLLAGMLTLNQIGTSLAAGWQQTDSTWSWIKDDGQKVMNDWQQSGSGDWYYFDGSGNMVTGFLDIGDSRYYLEQDASSGTQGKMITGWKQIGPDWYFFYPKSASYENPTPCGAMLSGWQWIDGKCYYFNLPAEGSYGSMRAGGAAPDGSALDESGAWTENGVPVYIDGKGISTAPEPAGPGGGVAGPGGIAGGGGTSIGGGGSSGGGGGGGGSSSGGGGSSGGGSTDGDLDDNWDDELDDYTGSNMGNYYNDFVHGNTGAVTSAQQKEIDAVIKAFKEDYITGDMSDFEKEIQIIRYMVENCDYEKADDWSRATAYSSLVLGRAQCAGYADGFLQMAEACGIEARYVSNNIHAWNQVKIGGKWYHVDVTFEDPTGGNDYGFDELRNLYINLEDSEIRMAYAHRTWNSRAYTCGNYEYGPPVVAHYLETGEVDTSRANTFEERCNRAIKKYEYEDGSNHFAIKNIEEGKTRVYEFMKSRIEARKDTFSYIIDFPKSYNYTNTGDYVKISNMEEEIDEYVQARLAEEYGDILNRMPYTRMYSKKYADGTFTGTKDGNISYKQGQGRMIPYTIRFQDKNGVEIQTVSGLIEAGYSLDVPIPDAYKFRHTVSGTSDTVRVDSGYTQKIRLYVEKAETEKADVTIQLLRKDDLTENFYSVRYGIYDISQSPSITMLNQTAKIQYAHDFAITIPEGYTFSRITETDKAQVSIKGDKIYVKNVTGDVNLYIDVVTDEYAAEHTFTYTLHLFTREDGNAREIKTVTGTKLKYGTGEIVIADLVPDGYCYKNTGMKKSMAVNAGNAYGSGWDLIEDRSVIRISAMVADIEGYILIEPEKETAAVKKPAEGAGNGIIERPDADHTSKPDEANPDVTEPDGTKPDGTKPDAPPPGDDGQDTASPSNAKMITK